VGGGATALGAGYLAQGFGVWGLGFGVWGLGLRLGAAGVNRLVRIEPLGGVEKEVNLFLKLNFIRANQLQGLFWYQFDHVTPIHTLYYASFIKSQLTRKQFTSWPYVMQIGSRYPRNPAPKKLS